LCYRDQVQALQYYEQAADLGNAEGMCGSANMYLKGEGMPNGSTNVTKAIETYENASKLGSIRAFNGLGFIYFYGQVVPKNETKAFEYFLSAAETENDAESLFNAGYCLENGLGTSQNSEKAVQFYNLAAQKFGSFDSICSLGSIHIEVIV
jgi:TPR repeat protein